MSDTLKKLTIEGYRSIRRLEEFPLRELNVLIGANGAGKSNFVSFFNLLREMAGQRLQVALATTEGGADACLHLGPKVTPGLAAKLDFGERGYEFSLLPTPDNRLIFAHEATAYKGRRSHWGSGHAEAILPERKDVVNPYWENSGPVCDALSGLIAYHFDDTSLLAPVRRQGEINDNEIFRRNAENLAPFLYRVRQTCPAVYWRIRDVVRLAAPFFDDFHLRPVPANPDVIQLEWRQRGSDYPFRAHQFSDGTLRFICLATALLQPAPPATLLFDEPELGLHPYALTLLGNLFRQASDVSGRQIIVSTQSALLLNEFRPEEVIVVERTNGESIFRRLVSSSLTEWLEEYSLGELWQKNVLRGRPRDERIQDPTLTGSDRRS
jgi:predicted ATPase